MYASPVVVDWAQSWSVLSAATLVGLARPLRMRTPWFASKYGVEKETTLARCAVMVTSSNAKSYFFGAGENSPPNGARRYWTLLIPSFLAIACESANSKPEGF